MIRTLAIWLVAFLLFAFVVKEGGMLMTPSIEDVVPRLIAQP